MTASRRRFGLVDHEAVEIAPLLHLYIRQQSIRLGQLACFDCFLRISFQGSDFRIVARSNRCRCLKVLEALCDFDKLGSQSLLRNVILAENGKRGTHLASIKVQLFLEQDDVISLLSGQFFQRAFRIANKFIHLLLWDADDKRGTSDTAPNSDASGIRPDLSIGSGNRRKEAHAQCCNKRRIPFHGRHLLFRF